MFRKEVLDAKLAELNDEQIVDIVFNPPFNVKKWMAIRDAFEQALKDRGYKITHRWDWDNFGGRDTSAWKTPLGKDMIVIMRRGEHDFRVSTEPYFVERNKRSAGPAVTGLRCTTCGRYKVQHVYGNFGTKCLGPVPEF